MKEQLMPGEGNFNPESKVGTLPRPHERAILTKAPEIPKPDIEPTEPISLEEIHRRSAQSGFNLPESQQPLESHQTPITNAEPSNPQFLVDIGLMRADAAQLNPARRESPLTPEGEKAQEAVFGRPTGGIKPATPEQVAEFEEALKTKDFRGQEVLGEEIKSGDARALRLKNRQTGEITIRRLQQTEGVVAAGVYGDPEPHEVDTEPKAREWVEKQIRSLEGDPVQDENTVVSFLNTVRSKIPEHVPGLKVELVQHARARLRYHNAAYKSRLSLGKFGEEFLNIEQIDHEHIFSRPGFREGVDEWISNEGSAFRRNYISPGVTFSTDRVLPNGTLIPAGTVYAAGTSVTDLEEAKMVMREHLLATATKPDPAGGGGAVPITDYEAELAVELSEKAAHIYGESGHFDGVRLRPLPGAGAPPDPELAALRANLAALGQMSPDGWVHFNLPSGESDLEAYANFYVENWNQIDEGTSIGGVGAPHMRRIFQFPAYLRKPANRRVAGQARGLHPWAYLYAGSGIRYETPQSGAKDSLRDFVDNYSGSDYVKMLDWASAVSKIHEGRVQFAEKSRESILVVPLINPDSVDISNSSETMPKVMDNFIKIAAAFPHLPDGGLPTPSLPSLQVALEHVLIGLLRYESSQAARNDLYTWLPWDSTIKNRVIYWAAQPANHLVRGVIGDIRRMQNAVNTSQSAAVGRIVGHHAGEGVLKSIMTFFGQVGKTK